MAEWLSSARKKKSRDIRSFIPVHGKILKPKSTSLNLESSSRVEYLVTETPGAWPRNSSARGKQLSLVQISKQDAAAKGMFQKVPASSLSTGIRRKTARAAAMNETQEEVFTIEDKENFDSEVSTHTSPPSCHRESHTQPKQQSSPTKKSMATLGKHKISGHEQCWVSYSNQRHRAHCGEPDECLTQGSHTAEALEGDLRSYVRASPQKFTRQAAQASESTPNSSPPTKRLRTEFDSSNSNSCGAAKMTCSYRRKAVRAMDLKESLGPYHSDNDILQKHELAMAHEPVQMVRTKSRSTLQSAAEFNIVATQESTGTSVSTLSVRNFQPGCIAHVDNLDGTTADVADTNLASSRIEEEDSFSWDSEPVPKSQGLFSCSTSNIIDTDELLAELSNCEKIV